MPESPEVYLLLAVAAVATIVVAIGCFIRATYLAVRERNYGLAATGVLFIVIFTALCVLVTGFVVQEWPRHV
jgi:hypothetical protein